MITPDQAAQIVANAAKEITEELASDTVDVSLFELGALIGAILLRSSTNHYAGKAQDNSMIQSMLSDGVNEGLNLHAEQFGIDFREDPRMSCHGTLLN